MASLRGLVRSTRHVGASTCMARTGSVYAQRLSRQASSEASSSSCSSSSTDPFQELELASSMTTKPLASDVKLARPLERARQRGERLPGSRYQYHPPKYDRGPLHPIQSPASSDPTARDFVPGPFQKARLRETYQSTIASDLMTLGYTHQPADEPREPTPDRLRSWDGSSPYHKNRPKRGPKGDRALRLLEKPISFRNIPDLKSVTIAAFMPEAIRDHGERLTVARTVLQAITGEVPEVTKVRRSVAQWHITKGQKAGVKVTLHGNAAYEFLDKCVHIVFPRIKEWPGVRGSTGDSSGNLAWGLTPEDVALFPEVEATYSMYPARMIPGFRMFVQTTANSDRHARLLLGAFGVPFYGELRD